MLFLMRWKAIATGLLCVTAYAHAGDIYQWKDAQGKVHIGDMVPHQYAKQAKKINAKVNASAGIVPIAPAASAASTATVQNGEPAAASADTKTGNQGVAAPKHRADQPGHQLEWDDPLKGEQTLYGKQPMEGKQPLEGKQPADGVWPMDTVRPLPAPH